MPPRFQPLLNIPSDSPVTPTLALKAFPRFLDLPKELQRQTYEQAISDLPSNQVLFTLYYFVQPCYTGLAQRAYPPILGERLHPLLYGKEQEVVYVSAVVP